MNPMSAVGTSETCPLSWECPFTKAGRKLLRSVQTDEHDPKPTCDGAVAIPFRIQYELCVLANQGVTDDCTRRMISAWRDSN
jgi:hypothetical protein